MAIRADPDRIATEPRERPPLRGPAVRWPDGLAPSAPSQATRSVQPHPSVSPRLSPDPGVRPPPRALPSLSLPVIAGPLVHRPTKAHPLRVLAVGDSIGEDLAIGLARALSGRKSFVLKTDARQATSLARP